MPNTPSHQDLHRPFRPRAARVVATVFALLVLGSALVLVALLPQVADGRDSWGDRLGIMLVALVVVWFLARHGGVRADPDDDGLTVRNLLLTRRVTWAEIVSVRFGGGRPWVQLDLADGETLAVMAVQQADGAWAMNEAKRLSTLVALHSTTSRDD